MKLNITELIPLHKEHHVGWTIAYWGIYNYYNTTTEPYDTLLPRIPLQIQINVYTHVSTAILLCRQLMVDID